MAHSTVHTFNGIERIEQISIRLLNPWAISTEKTYW